MAEQEPPRPLGKSGLTVQPIALGCWPIAGVTSVDVHEAQSLETLEAALDAGVDHFDTAHVYGYEGESERLIGQTLAQRGSGQRLVTVATKGGIHWQGRTQVRDGSPDRLRRECEISLGRLGRNEIDLLYLHAPDPEIPIRESAGELNRLLVEGKARSIGVSNATLQECAAFAQECPLTAVQPAYNMLQRGIEADLLPWCIANQVAVLSYWPLMKGLLAGRLERDHQFDPRDGRPKYPIYQGEAWQRNQDFVDRLRELSREVGKTVAQIVLNWTMHRPGVTAVLAGAKRAVQMKENAGAMGWRLSAHHLQMIEAAIQERGPTDETPAVSRPQHPNSIAKNNAPP